MRILAGCLVRLNVGYVFVRICLTWIVSEMSGAVFLSAASRISSKKHVAFLCSFHLAFSPCVYLASVWCIHTIVLIHSWIVSDSVYFIIDH